MKITFSKLVRHCLQVVTIFFFKTKGSLVVHTCHEILIDAPILGSKTKISIRSIWLVKTDLGFVKLSSQVLTYLECSRFILILYKIIKFNNYKKGVV